MRALATVIIAGLAAAALAAAPSSAAAEAVKIRASWVVARPTGHRSSPKSLS